MSSIVKIFNKVANMYDEWYRHPQGKQIFEAELEAVNSLIPLRGIGLELGAGTGMFADNLQRIKRTIICLDSSQEMLSKARKRCNYILMGVAEQLPLRTAILDFTYLVTVLEFLIDPTHVLREVQRNAKAGAPVTLLFINSDSTWGSLYKELGAKGDPVYKNAKLYTLEEVNKMLRNSGYLVRKSVGTITTSPTEQVVGGDIMIPGPSTGVIIVQAFPFS